MYKNIFVKVFAITLVFYFFMFVAFQLFSDLRGLRVAVGLSLIVIVSVFLCREFIALTGKEKTQGITAIIFFLFSFYELFKFSRYMMGDLPRYLEQPVISAVVSFALVVLYVGVLNLSLVILRKMKSAM